LKKLSLTIFTNYFITMLLGIFPIKLGKKESFTHWDRGPYTAPKRQSENHCRHSMENLTTKTHKLSGPLLYEWSRYCLHIRNTSVIPPPPYPHPVFSSGRVAWSLVFCVLVCRLLFDWFLLLFCFSRCIVCPSTYRIILPFCIFNMIQTDYTNKSHLFH
jgi:hypothetical protein